MVAWAAAEGWNPGRHDAACFLPQDATGFFVGRLGGELVSAVSVVAYDEAFAFLGYYLVAPDRRGQGHGIATWRAALPHAGARTIGLDAVPAQQDNYRRSGFHPAYGTARYAGPIQDGPAPVGVQALTKADIPAVVDYDRACFPAERSAFLGRWVNAPGHTAYLRVREGRLTGYGVIRPSQDGYRIGPLFADTGADARALFDALVAGKRGASVAVDIPQAHQEATELALGRGLSPSFQTVRMYTGPIRGTALDRIYGVTSLELG